TAHDLRGGVALVIAALGADGESVVQDIHQLERGYEDLPDKLRRLGADVEVEVWSEADHPSYDALWQGAEKGRRRSVAAAGRRARRLPADRRCRLAAGGCGSGGLGVEGGDAEELVDGGGD